MLATGRRRSASLSPLTIFLGLIILFTASANAAVLGIDFGTLNIKAAIVKPGIPLDIVLTKDSKRKEVAAVAFKPNRDEKNQIVAQAGTFPERAYGSDALALQGRLPGEVFPNLKALLGLQPGSEAAAAVESYQQRYPGVHLEHVEELGTTVFKSTAFVDEALPFSVEELIGMELANIKRNAEAMAGKGSVVEDAVITIPAFYTSDERTAIVKAANFAGLQVMSLISDGLAVGLDYAKSRTFPEVTKGEKPEYHLVYDMGAGSTTATVLRFQGKSVKDVGRFNKTVQEVSVIGAGWDRKLGGDSLNHVLMDEFVHRLLTKPVLKSRGIGIDTVAKNGRVMARFFKEAERVRQILSANNEASASFEEILPDVDLRVKITRAEFEQLAAKYAEDVATPINEALSMAKLTMADLNSIILHGGAVRTPFVQSKLEDVVDDKAKLRSNVNPDESAVFGAAFKAASLSASFKVKEIRASDVASYAIALMHVDRDKERKKPLFSSTSLIGAGATTKQVTFKDKEDFEFGFVQNVNGIDLSVSKVQSGNLTASVEELQRRAGCEKESISTKFSIRLGPNHGLPEITGGSVSCEIDETKSGSVGDSVKGWLGLGKKKEQEPLGAGEEDGPVEQVDATASADATSETAGSSSASGTASGTKAAQTPKKSIESIPLRWTVSPEGSPQPSREQLAAMTSRLGDFDRSDKTRYARDEAQNVLESYTYYVRDFLENKDWEIVSTADERGAISKALQSTRDWMDSSDLGKATQVTLKEKYDALTKLIGPIQKRRSEDSDRPELVKNLQKTLDELQKAMLRVESDAAKAASSIAQAATSSESSSATPVPSSDDFDDLEVPDTTESTPQPSPTPLSNPYADIDLSPVRETYDSITTWLREKLAEQAQLQPYDDPVLLTKDIERKNSDLAASLQDLLNRASRAGKASSSTTKKPKPTKSKSARAAKSATSTAATDDAVEPDVPLEDEAAAEETRQQQKKPITGAESLDDMINLMKNKKDKDTDKAQKPASPDVHEEL